MGALGDQKLTPIVIPIGRALTSAAHHAKEAIQTFDRRIYRLFSSGAIGRAWEDLERSVSRNSGFIFNHCKQGLETAGIKTWRATTYLSYLTLENAQKITRPVWRGVTFVAHHCKECFQTLGRTISRALSFSAQKVIYGLQNVERPVSRTVAVAAKHTQEAVGSATTHVYRKTEFGVMKSAETLSSPVTKAKRGIGFFAKSSQDKLNSFGVHAGRALDDAATQVKKGTEIAASGVDASLTYVGKHIAESSETVGRGFYRGVSDINPLAAFWRRVEERDLFSETPENYGDSSQEKGGYDQDGYTAGIPLV